MALGFVAFKPQLVMGPLMMWIARFPQMKGALLGFFATVLSLAVVGEALLRGATEVWIRELPNAPNYFDERLLRSNSFAVWDFAGLVAPPWTATIVTVTVVAIVVGGFLWWMRRVDKLDLQFAGAVVVSLLISPHVVVYDWTLLLIPAVVLWRSCRELRELWLGLGAALSAAAFAGGLLTDWQIEHWGAGIQLATLVLLVSAFIAGRATLAPAMPGAPATAIGDAQSVRKRYS